MKDKLKTCKSCGQEIAKSAKVCPNCGAKNKKPIYQRVWFIILCVIVVMAAISSMGGGDNNDAPESKPSSSQSENAAKSTEKEEPIEEQITYEEVSVTKMMETLKANALKAEKTYNDKNVEITGRLNVIDSDGKYISLVPEDDEWAINGVTCYIKGEDQLNRVMEMSLGDTVVLNGTITEVGEILGYNLKVNEIIK